MKRSTLIPLMLLAVAAVGCTKQSLKTAYDKQTTYIENFISAQMKTDTSATLTRNGDVCRLILHDTLDARRDSLLPGGKVALYYACYTLTSASVSRSNLVATNREELAAQAGWALSDPSRYKLDTLTLGSTLVKGLEAGLAGVQEKDEGYILFTGEYGYGGSQRGTIPARSALVYQIWIQSIDNN
ncbi:MAG: hypothetical protein J6M31_05975 [Bacteroidales bacterium]|nr:hypothetical protein [Bacteroidales bacterium]